MSINFINKDLYFQVGAYKLTKKQKEFLTSFAKKLMPFLKINQEKIANLEVNGHTSSEWNGTSFESRYLNNSKLSLERSFSTLSYIFKQQSNSMQILLTKILKGSGLSYSQKIMIEGNEDSTHSRRVAFKIILK